MYMECIYFIAYIMLMSICRVCVFRSRLHVPALGRKGFGPAYIQMEAFEKGRT